jgi:hypothetical protein
MRDRGFFIPSKLSGGLLKEEWVAINTPLGSTRRLSIAEANITWCASFFCPKTKLGSTPDLHSPNELTTFQKKPRTAKTVSFIDWLLLDADEVSCFTRHVPHPKFLVLFVLPFPTFCVQPNAHRRSFLIFLPFCKDTHSFVSAAYFFDPLFSVSAKFHKFCQGNATRETVACTARQRVERKQRSAHDAHLYLPFHCGCPGVFRLGYCLSGFQLWKHIHRRLCEDPIRFRSRIQVCEELGWNLRGIHQC